MNSDLHNGHPLPPGWKVAEAWSLNTGAAGAWLIYGALGCYLVSILLWLLSKRYEKFGKWGGRFFVLGGFCLFGSMFCLGALFVQDQFQFDYVRARADVSTALKYKIAGIWSGQQGSFLLWACASAIFGILAAPKTGAYRRWFTFFYALFLGSLASILAYETPFLVSLINGAPLIPPSGNGLTPSLQNYWVVIHPPTIFLGFGSLTVLFCWSLSAMLTQGEHAPWFQGVRPWTILSVAILGLGLCMGGFWAYETLGWGGFWMWDPVENVSFVPWIFAAVFVHGLIVQSARGMWSRSNLLFAGLPFLSFVYGTFLTRSGFLTDASVHSFAKMDHNALWILVGLLIVLSVTFLLVWGICGRRFEKPQAAELEQKIAREGMYRSGSMLLILTALTAAIGMSFPFIQALMGQKSKIVDEHLYHQVLAWIFVPLMIYLGAAPFVSWRGLSVRELFDRLFTILWISLFGAGVGVLALRYSGLIEGQKTIWTLWLAVLIFCCCFVGVANLLRIKELLKRAPMSIGGLVAHLGIAVMLGGLIVSRGFEQHGKEFVQEGTPVRILDYAVMYLRQTGKDIYDRENKVEFQLLNRSSNTRFIARPGLYFTLGEKNELQPMTWPHIERTLTHDVYFTLHPPAVDTWPEPVSFKPGETKTVQGIEMTYKQMTMEGEPGQAGTKFGALVTAKVKGEMFAAHPKLELQPGSGPKLLVARLNDQLIVSMQALDAGTKSAVLQVHFARPIYPVEIFYKPMTILVWLGTGILTLGGLLAAFYRRRGVIDKGIEDQPIP